MLRGFMLWKYIDEKCWIESIRHFLLDTLIVDALRIANAHVKQKGTPKLIPGRLLSQLSGSVLLSLHKPLLAPPPWRRLGCRAPPSGSEREARSRPQPPSSSSWPARRSWRPHRPTAAANPRTSAAARAARRRRARLRACPPSARSWTALVERVWFRHLRKLKLVNKVTCSR